ncbi:hypothetical protein KM043_003855 [Ampulex compressa]|nr:hypothetical protein KM043_003855 [Ampulex compressa]
MNALVIAALSLLAVATSGLPLDKARPGQGQSQEPVPVLAYTFDGPHPDGSYSYSYETGNGLKVEERGGQKRLSEQEEALTVQGSYSFTLPDGTPVALSYVADENGFQPKADHLPTPHPIPAGILKSLEYIAAHPEEDDQK